MPVTVNTLKTAVKAAFDAEKEQTGDQQGSIDRISQAIADAVADAVVQGVNSAEIAMLLTSATGGPVSGSITITASKA